MSDAFCKKLHICWKMYKVCLAISNSLILRVSLNGHSFVLVFKEGA